MRLLLDLLLQDGSSLHLVLYSMHVWTLPLLPIEALLEASDLSKVLPLCFSLGKQGMLVVELVLPVDLGLPYLIGVGIVAERDRIDE